MSRVLAAISLSLVLAVVGCSNNKKPASAEAPDTPTMMPPTDEKGKTQIPQAPKQSMTP